MTKYDLDGKTVLITGATSGIGQGAAEVCAASGARVIVCGTNEDRLTSTVQSIKDAGGEAVRYAMDVRKAADCERSVALAVETYGRLDAAFNSAGILGPPFTPILELKESEWDDVIEVNLKGVWLCLKYQVAQMIRQGGGGSIVNASSVAGLVGTKMNSAYGASKHGVTSLSRSVALEYAEQGIRVNAVCPGWIETAMTDAVTDRYPERLPATVARHPIGRAGKPREIGELVAWLCSDASSFVTGAAYSIDGGVTTQ